SIVVCARSWNDRVLSHPARSAGTPGCPANPQLARPSPAHCRCPRNTPPSAAESRCRAPVPADPASRHKTVYTPSLRTHQTGIRLTTGSTGHRTDGWPDAPMPPLQPTTLLAVAAAAAFPSPYPILRCNILYQKCFLLTCTP